ncbi:MAG: S-layer homology domain-containing protein [Acidimicrobiales bacterium]
MRRNPRTRSLLSAFLAAVISLTAISTGTANAATGFGDVETDTYYADAVAWMVDAGITTGIEAGCFGPSLDVSRGQVATFLHRLDASLGNEPSSDPHPFGDVVADYQQAPVGWLYSTGLTTGVSSDQFAPRQSITRGDFAVLLWRYAGSPTPTTASSSTGVSFTDVTRAYQRDAIAWMADEGITTGTSSTTFDPDGPVSRAQAAAFLFRFVGPTDVDPAPASVTCTRETRLALQVAGLTAREAACAVPWLTTFELDYLLAVVSDQETASFELIVAAATIGTECLTPSRIADLSRVFL